MPYAAQSFVDLNHDLRRLAAPAELKELLPNMARVPVDDRFRDSTQKLVHHDSFVLLRHTIEGFLDHMAPKRIHTQSERVPSDRIGDGDNLFGSSMLKAALNQEVTETIDHERVRLLHNCLDNIVFLLCGTDLEFLLEKDGSLLVIVAHNFVHNVFPIARYVLIEKTSIVEWLKRRDVSLNGVSIGLDELLSIYSIPHVARGTHG